MPNKLISSLQFRLCPLCNSASSKPFHRESGYTLVRCRRCRLIYVNPQPTERDLWQHYQEYLPSSPQEIQKWGQMMLPVIRTSARLILDHFGKERGRLLDVGCGYGFFLSQMRSLGFEVQGIDISETALTYAREQMDLIVSNHKIQEFKDQSFDILTAFYVIEHVPDPRNMLKEFYRVLKPGGFLLLRWPHTAPLTLLTRWWHDFRLHDVPSHLTDFSPTTLKRMLETLGFYDVFTTIGGYTSPPNAKRLTAFFGKSAQFLEFLTAGALLMPGVSKSTIAFKPTPYY
jgi:ubiquinone/menaquinone biosynthesis C-methylase UbiE